MTAGLGGVHRHGSVALAEGGTLVGVCQQERVTRVRHAGFNATGVPDEALDALLWCHGRSRADVERYVVAGAHEPYTAPPGFESVDHHFAHACTAYLSSPFPSATVVVCDGEAPKVSVWRGREGTVTRVEWPWDGPGFGDVYARFARAMGFGSEAGEQRFEALARLAPEARDSRVNELVATDGHGLRLHPQLESSIEEWRSAEQTATPCGARLASALQARLGEVFLEFLREVRVRTESPNVCLAGSFFYHSSINTVAMEAGLFESVFVPVDPGDAGLAVGAALQAGGGSPASVSPFCGPAYSTQDIKETLDNCKLQYEWQSEDQTIATAVRALQQHTLVAWFDGAMEWGPRALGARCILANPFAPYVLENLNHFLKRREPWRGYAISGLEEAVAEHFDGPARTPFMNGDYRPREPQAFGSVLPASGAAIRVQTVGTEAPERFRRLLSVFGEKTGLPYLVNTSFNGFHEPIVCSPRDAVRVFFGSGLDVMVLGQFVLRK